MIQLDPAIEAKYELLAAMGEGGMGTVYKVRHRHLDRVRVIKLIRDRARADENLTARFLREAKTAAKLRHPNIAEVIDYDVTAQGTAFIVMEFVDGLNLREVVRRAGGTLEYGFVIGVALQTLSALAYLHRMGFVHRDISPDNLMLTTGSGAPEIKLIDLGIAKAVQATRDLTVDGHFVGKVRYASPEQFTGETIDHRSDLYSLGVVLYELLTGEAPITGSDYKAVIAGHLSRPPRDFSETDPDGHVPQELRAAVMKALAKEPGDRHADAVEFAAALESVSASLPPARMRDRGTVAVSPDYTTRIPADLATRLIEQSTVIQAIGAITDDDSAQRRLDGASVTRPRIRKHRAVIAATLVAIAAIVILLVNRPGREASRPPDPLPPSASGPKDRSGAPSPGQLVLNGLPWGEVVEVVGTDGRNRIAGKPLYTPAVLTLEPGPYRIVFSNPLSGRRATVDAEVKPAQAVTCQARLDEIDAAAWLREAP